MRWLTDPYTSQFMRNAAAIALVVGVVAPVVGVWVVLRRLAYLGDAMSHGTLAGVALGYLTGVGVVAGALVAGLVMGFGVAWLERRPKVGQDAAIGVVETALFATGVLVISSTDRIGVDLTHFLFGQIVTVGRSDIVVNVALAIGALTIVGARFGDLRATAFDEEHAAQVGIHVDRLRLTLLGLISITVVISLDTVGLLMSVAMLVTPAAAARLITTRVETMTAVAVGIGTSSALGGLTLSYHLGTPPGPTIALTTVAWFGTVWAHTARKARLAPSRHQRP